MQTHEYRDGIWSYTLQYRINYFVQYYQRMKWIILPEDLLDMCAEDAYDTEGQYAWNILMNARNYLIRQHFGQ